MPSQSFRERFHNLPFYRKLILFGSALSALAVFFPWYSDLDSHNIGDTFLGITGPLSLIGVLILLGGVVSLLKILAHMYGRTLPALPLREAVLHMTIGIESLLFLVVAASVYFHPKFGLNIISKEPRFGILLTAVGMILLIVGGYYQNQYEGADDTDMAALQPLAAMPRHERPEVSHRAPVTRTTEDVREVPTEFADDSEEVTVPDDESPSGAEESEKPSLGF